MSEHATVAVPSVREVRAGLREARRAHSDRTLGELLTDVYLIGFIVVIYGSSTVVWTRKVLSRPIETPGTTAEQRVWLVVAMLLLATALLWRGMRAVGPLVTTPAAQVWCIATPIDRGRWLRASLWLTLGGTMLLGALVATMAAWAGFSAGGIGWAALAGAGIGAMLASAAVIGQARGHERGPGSVAVIAVGVGVAAAVLFLDVEVTLPRLPGVIVAAAAGLGAVVLVREAMRALPRVDRTTLSAGSQLGAAMVGAAVMLDPALLSGLVATRRWRRARRVHSRHFLPGNRDWVLLQADLLRQLRRGPAVLTWAALLLVPYTVAAFAPLAVGPARVIAAYLAVDRLAGGLRAVARSAALRRLLGGTDASLRLIHLVVPGLGLALWWLASAPAGPALAPLLDAVLLVGVLGSVYRTATRKPMSYDGGLADSPFGPVATGLLRQTVRGPDLVAVLALLAYIFAP